MKRFTFGLQLRLSFVVLGLVLFCRIPAALALTPQEIADIALRSTVLITMKNTRNESYIGSGFVIGDGQVATNYHVIEGITSGTVQRVGEVAKHPIVSVIASDKSHDLAIVEVTGLSAPALVLGDSDAVQVGQSVYAAGNPQGLTGTFSTGVISAIRPEGNSLVEDRLLQITAPISQGVVEVQYWTVTAKSLESRLHSYQEDRTSILRFPSTISKHFSV